MPLVFCPETHKTYTKLAYAISRPSFFSPLLPSKLESELQLQVDSLASIVMPNGFSALQNNFISLVIVATPSSHTLSITSWSVPLHGV